MKEMNITMNNNQTDLNGPLAKPATDKSKKKKVSKALKTKLLTILCRELNEELGIIKKNKATQIKNQKAVRVRSIKSKRKGTTEMLPSKRFKMLQKAKKSNATSETERVNPFARRKARSNPANIFQINNDNNKNDASNSRSTSSNHTNSNNNKKKDRKKKNEISGKKILSTNNNRKESKTIFNNKPITNDMTEENIHKLVVVKLTQAFRINIKKGFEKTLNKICTNIAESLSKGFNGCKNNEYRNRFRTILFNLRRNKDLCTKILSNNVSPEDVALKMTTLQMASKKKQKEVKQHLKELQKNAQIKDDGLPWNNEVDMKCKKCLKVGNVVSYTIEESVNSKVNIWAGSSSNNISGTKYKCKTCGFRWSSSDD